MLAITLQDLRFRWRQFLIAVIGAALVFAMTLLLAGLEAGFGVEIDQTLAAMGATSWVLAAGASDRIASMPPMNESAVRTVAGEPGVTKADPLITVPQAADVGRSEQQSINLIGVRPGGLGSPVPVAGRPLGAADTAVVDTAMGVPIGHSFEVSGHRFLVVGTVTDRTLLGGTPNVYVNLTAAQQVVYFGRPLIQAVLIDGTPRTVPHAFELRSTTQIKQASLDQLSSVASSIKNSRGFMWVIATVIVAALIYVSALERTRDFAVFKALGSSSRLLFAGLAVQAVAVALAAAIIASIISNFMTGVFDQPVDIPGNAFVYLPLSAVVVGVLASLAALRRAVSVDPAMAFAGA